MINMTSSDQNISASLKKIVLDWGKLFIKMPKAVVVRFTPHGALVVDASDQRVYLVRVSEKKHTASLSLFLCLPLLYLLRELLIQ